MLDTAALTGHRRVRRAVATAAAGLLLLSGTSLTPALAVQHVAPTAKTPAAQAPAARTPAAQALTVTTTSLPDASGGAAYSAKLAAKGGVRPYTWSVTAGALPPGLTMVPATGFISGHPTAGGSFPFTAGVSDSASPPDTATANLSITVNVAPLTVTTPPLPPATDGVPYSAKLTATGGIHPYTWSLVSGPLPAGLRLNPATGAITGKPSAPQGSSAVTVQLTDAETPPAIVSSLVVITVHVAPLVVTTGSTLPTASPGLPYSVRLAAAGGTAPYTWSITAGTLPPGLTLHRASGIISGTPSAAGTSGFTVAVTDSGSPPAVATAGEALTVATPLTVDTASLPAATAGQPYTATLTASGGVPPYRWAIGPGSLPTGLILNLLTGVISGTPTAGGTANFTADVTDHGTPPGTASASLSITVAQPLSVTTTSLPTAIVGQPYATTLTATGGLTPYTWSVAAGQGSLPAGLSLDPATGTISGTPTAPGNATFKVQVTDSSTPPATATASLSITVAQPLSVTTTSLPTATVGQPYATALTATGGTVPYTWSVTSGSLPGGLTLDPATGQISGTPSAPGNASFTVQVTDSGSPPGTATANLSITVAQPLSVTTTSLPTATVGQPYATALTATGGLTPYTWSVAAGQGSLPAGLSLDPATGQISGTPTAPGNATFKVQVTDSSTPPATATATLTINVVEPLVVTTSSMPQEDQGQSYSATLAATGGVAPYTWSVTSGSLPPGLSLNPATGQVSGTAEDAGTFGFTVQVTDSGRPPATASANLGIDISMPLMMTNVHPLPNGTVGQLYSVNLTSTGGVSPVTWSISGGMLPPGLNLEAQTGQILGASNGALGTFSFTVELTDSSSVPASVTQNYSITIAPQLMVVPIALPPNPQGAGYSASLQATGGFPPYTWAVTGGVLPPGLTLVPNGAIVGSTPVPGEYPFTVTVTDSDGNTAQANLEIDVIPVPGGGRRR